VSIPLSQVSYSYTTISQHKKNEGNAIKALKKEPELNELNSRFVLWHRTNLERFCAMRTSAIQNLRNM
jgi:hypothetical protein